MVTTPTIHITRDDVLVDLAHKTYELIQKHLDDGTASSQLMTAMIAMDDPLRKAKAERIVLENELIQAKIDKLKRDALHDEQFDVVLDAIARYSGGDYYE